MAQKIYLRILEAPILTFQCTACDFKINGHNRSGDDIGADFLNHLKDKHPAKEDVNQAAARTLRELTQGK
jgi:hypothetical protein